jgi:gamma-glutamylcyclotransferase (GGCT)/AIG2-like uncharacterized protein YtfP
LVALETGGSVVEGELYEVETTLRASLDAVEGAPSLYRLLPVDLDGQAGPVYSYIYQRETSRMPRIASGRWENNRAGGDKPRRSPGTEKRGDESA